MEKMIIMGLLAVIALLVRVGMALYVGGLSRSKNSAGAVLRLVCDLCTALVVYLGVGWAIQFQVSHELIPWIDYTFPPAGRQEVWPLFMYAVVVLMWTGIVSGALAERSKFYAIMAASALLAGLIVPVVVCWMQFGWLWRIRFIDVGGAAWLHVTGGLCAAAGAYLVGPRANKYHRDGSASIIPGHNIPMAAIGALVMIPGWIAYVAACQNFVARPPTFRHEVGREAEVAQVTRNFDAGGKKVDIAALNVLAAAAAGGLASLLFAQVKYGKPDVLLTLTGLMGGMVAASAGGGWIPWPWAGVVGAVAGVIVPWAAVWIDLRLRIDDPAAGIAIHAVGGAWGVLSVGLFCPGGFMMRLKQLGIQAVGLLAIAAVAASLSFWMFHSLKAAGQLRAKEADEFDGLDLAEHDIAAYPDFQHNSIRSYHMREA